MQRSVYVVVHDLKRLARNARSRFVIARYSCDQAEVDGRDATMLHLNDCRYDVALYFSLDDFMNALNHYITQLASTRRAGL